jgi:YidC/Oxa1 family membrane protein insertase
MYAIFTPIANVLGFILNLLFEGMYRLGIGNVGLAIILFTLIVKLCMMPLTVKQSRMQKLQMVMQPEIDAIQKKYKGKNSDQQAMLNMQAEMKEVYDKYGISQLGGCLQLIIQMPILFGLYQVFREIPAYVSRLAGPLQEILTSLSANPGFKDTLNGALGMNVDWDVTRTAEIAMSSLTPSQWQTISGIFPNSADVISQSVAKLDAMNNFLGVSMSQTPQAVMGIAILIPILSGVTQFISVKVAQVQNPTSKDKNNPMNASMNMMMYFMPIMSAWFAFSLPSGLGLYWIATAVIQTIQTVIVNRRIDEIGVDKIVEQNQEKRRKKLEKKGLTSTELQGKATINTRQIGSSYAQRYAQAVAASQAARPKTSMKEKAGRAGSNVTAEEERQAAAAAQTVKAAPGSLAAKAGMVAEFNNRYENRNKKYLNRNTSDKRQ